MLSVHVKAMRLDLAIIRAGLYSVRDIAEYSSHHPSGTDECRKTSSPSRMERQSDSLRGMWAAPRTDMGR